MNFKNVFTFKNVIFIILLIIFLRFLSNILGVFMIFFTAFVLASSLDPLVVFLEKKMSRAAASVLVVILSIIASIAFLIPILRLAFDQIIAFTNALPQRLEVFDNYISQKGFYGQDLAKMLDLNALIGSAGDIAKNVVDHSLNATMGVFNFIVLFIAILMIMFYLIKDKAYMTDKFVEFVPNGIKEKARCIIDAISVKVGGYVIAQLLSNTAIWFMVTAVLFAFGVDYAVVLGLIAGTLDLIPIVGPTIALVLIILAAYHLGVIKVALIILFFLFIQQISNSLVRPVIFGKFMDLHPLVIIFSIFICAQFLGILGVVLAPAIGATVCVLLDELYLKPINKAK